MLTPALAPARPLLHLQNKYVAPVIAKGQYYPAEDVAKPAKRSLKPTVAKLRASIQPGSVVILLAGRFKGRRVVVLQQLKSGLLLVSGECSARAPPPSPRVRTRSPRAARARRGLTRVCVADPSFLSSVQARMPSTACRCDESTSPT